VTFEKWRQGLLKFILTGLIPFDDNAHKPVQPAKKVTKPRARKRPTEDAGTA
jgi:hypothetical protein